ncbi:hypothetical protein SDC9_158251 [bioreactor metagenome]|uniref:Uncharacterized protein n=1 Tax=bioreactor metagenome TaxID=1076179 RepID=A0A645FEZ6_9ZZZZ
MIAAACGEIAQRVFQHGDGIGEHVRAFHADRFPFGIHFARKRRASRFFFDHDHVVRIRCCG